MNSYENRYESDTRARPAPDRLSQFVRFGRRAALLSAVSVCFLEATTAGAQTDAFDCGYQSREDRAAAIQAAVEAGEISDPLQRELPVVFERPATEGPAPRGGGVPTVISADIFPYEDSASVLVTDFSNGQLFDLMAEASNALMVAHGDNFDFIGFFVNFVPDHQIGSAFYASLENDVSGIGLSIFNDRAAAGVAGNNLEGWVMMWNQASWAADDTTMLVLGQELEHRFAMFLDPLLDGRAMQGTPAGCGRSAHWNWQIDGQGSGMEIREWIGSNPAVLGGDCAPGGFFFICFNSDIGDSPTGLGGVFSYSDLYLMGNVSPAEMDAGNSELRFMETSGCSSNYNGAISTFDSSDIIASNGVRAPDSTTAQQDFRTGWIMLHLPGSPPTAGELNNVVDILNRWSETWQWSTLNRGTMNNTLQLSFSIVLPNGAPETLVPNLSTTIDVQTINLSGQPDTSSGLLHVSVDGGPTTATALSFLGGGAFEATLPAVDCGSNVDFYISIEADGGGTVYEPTGAPSLTHIASAVQSTPIEDDFETDLGWTVSNDPTLTDGAWDRGTPIGGGDRGDPSTDFDGSGQCFLTDNVDGNSDVDGGSTTLTSPAFDIASLEDPRVSYVRWYSNTFGGSPQADIFEVEVSDNDGASWVNLETVGPTNGAPNPQVNGGWFVKTFRILDVVGLSNTFRIRFTASDLGSGSVVEAGVDAFKILDCSAPCAGHDGDLSGDGNTNGVDIQLFVDAAITESTDSTVLCSGDFDDSGAMGFGDLPGMVSALLK